MPSLPTFPTDRLHIRPWIDPVIDRLGHDPRSAYVETYWLGILGPSACWLLRRLADGMDAGPDGFDLDLPDTAAAIGLRLNGGRHAPFLRTLGRICQFRMARLSGSTTLEVRRNLPPLTLAQADHLPAALRDRHQQEQAAGRVHREADQARGHATWHSPSSNSERTRTPPNDSCGSGGSVPRSAPRWPAGPGTPVRRSQPPPARRPANRRTPTQSSTAPPEPAGSSPVRSPLPPNGRAGTTRPPFLQGHA